MEIAQKILFSCIRCEMLGRELPEDIKRLVTDETLKNVYVLSKRHDIGHFVFSALYKAGMIEENSKSGEAFAHQQQMAVYRFEQIHHELQRIYEAFDKAKIPYMPLKGSVIRDLYPEPWMRTSCDIDILVDEEHINAAVAILEEQLRYRNEGPGVHDVCLYSESGVHLELHYSLIEEDFSAQAVEVLSNIWVDVKSDNGCRFFATTEMFYCYHVIHMARHFVSGGCGIRPFLDMWLMKRKLTWDKQKADELLQKAGFLTFARAAERLANVWFSQASPDEVSLEMARYVLYGGVYGNTENPMLVGKSKKNGGMKYFLTRVFMPYVELVRIYPSLEKHKWANLFYQMRRWCKVIREKRLKNGLREMKYSAKNEKDLDVDKLVKKLEL
jgi:hypothetical protein